MITCSPFFLPENNRENWKGLATGSICIARDTVSETDRL